MNFSCRLSFQKVAFVIVLSLFATTTSAEIIFSSDDTTLLTNGVPTATESNDGEGNVGGRTSVILGSPNSTSLRHGLFRFDVSSLASQINSPTLQVVSASFLINEIDTFNFDQPTTTFSAFPVVSANSGWIEGTSTTTTSAFDGDGSVSYSYHTSPTFDATTDSVNADGQLWASAGGGPTGVFPSPNGFTFGTDTGSSLGSGSITPLDNGENDLLTIDLNAGTIDSLLVDWLANPTGNAGLAIEAAGTNAISFESAEFGGTGFGRLDVTFGTVAIPEPTSVALLSGVFTIAGLRRRRR